MISKRNDFSHILDDLFIASQNYNLNSDGVVVNHDNQEIKDDSVIYNTKMYTLYCMAYKEVAELRDGCPIKNINNDFIKRVLTDYDTFNSFVNNCIVEFNMYNGVGTGNISYFPNDALAKYFFSDINRTMFLDNYLCVVLKDYLNNELVNKRVK